MKTFAEVQEAARRANLETLIDETAAAMVEAQGYVIVDELCAVVLLALIMLGAHVPPHDPCNARRIA